MTNKEKVYDTLKQLYKDTNKGITSQYISNKLKISRANTSNYLNQLYKEGLVEKIKSRPVYFIPIDKNSKKKINYTKNSFSTFVGKRHSLKKVVEKAKAAILYPPYGLHTIIYGETGVGKSMLAKCMYDFSIECEVRSKESPFVTFNCADYANNPQLLMAHIFGVEKGAYTGAESSRKGLLEVANEGILFLDEIHRLPPEGQEMLFTFIDKGIFKRMGQSAKEISSQVLIIAATTEKPESTLLDTFNRRIPMTIEIPPLKERSLVERIELIKIFLKKEALRVGKPIKIHRYIIKLLLLYECKNNVGQLQSDIKLAVANAYLNYVQNSSENLEIYLDYFNKSLIKVGNNCRGKSYEVDILIPKDIDYYIFFPSGKEQNFAFKKISKNNEDKNKVELSLVREDIIENGFIEKLFMDTKFFKLCQDIRDIIQDELSVVLSEKRFCHMVVYINSIIDNNSFKNNLNKLDMNKIRQNNKKEFKVALKIINLIENEYNIFLSIEDAAYITLFLSKEIEEENKTFNSNVDVIVAMHGESTASSMVKAVKNILGQGNIYSFDMKLNKSYKEIVQEFKEMIKGINAKEGVLLFTDMGSLNSFDNIIKNDLGVEVKTISMVTTLTVLEAMQKLNIGFSLIQVYNSIMEMMNIGISRQITNKRKENMIIIGYNVSKGINRESEKIIRENLNTYIEDINILLIPHESEHNFRVTVNNLIQGNNVIAIIDECLLDIQGIECLRKDELKNNKGINKLKNIIKLNKGYCDIKEGSKNSLNYTNYSKLLKDVKVVIDNLFYVFNIEKQYDVVVGLIMHICFMVDSLVGNTRISEKFEPKLLRKNDNKLYMIKKQMSKLEKEYDIQIDENECYGILCILSDNICKKNNKN